MFDWLFDLFGSKDAHKNYSISTHRGYPESVLTQLPDTRWSWRVTLWSYDNSGESLGTDYGEIRGYEQAREESKRAQRKLLRKNKR